VAAIDDKAAARAPDPVAADGPAPPVEGEPPVGAGTPLPAREVRVAFAATQTSGDVVLVPPEEEVSGERPALPADEAFAAAEPTAPRRAADALPPRNRRASAREDCDTPPRGLHLVTDASDHDGRTSPDERPNKRPSSAPRPVLGRPMFEQEWGASPQGAPTWQPGAPPVDLAPSREAWWIVGSFALLGVGAIVLWLWWWT
jgi:hypothetical protein